jgi:Fe2+ transport system protein B
MIKYPIPKKLNYPITTEAKRNKYHNKKVLIDNITFDSLKEGNRYKELKLLEAKGIITDLQLQVKYELQPSYKMNDKTIRAISYICDFEYKLDNKLIVEDVKPSKNFQTEVYKIKKKLFMHKYGIEIKEI